MYSPSAFQVSDPSVIRAFLDEHSFGILISTDGGILHDSHTPLLVSGDLATITGHIAIANPQWKSWEAHSSVKVIFHGPHAYISPRFYQTEFNVPTWNYSAVSIDGTIHIIHDQDRSIQIIQNLISKYEGPSGWKLDTDDERYMKLLSAVVCFSIDVEKIDAKFKLNQNKSEEERQSVISHLLQSVDAMDQQTAKLMEMQD